MGSVIVASEHNTNFDTIYNEFNGSISNANISSTAAIGNAKLAAPNAYFTVPMTYRGRFTTTVSPLATYQMPFAATLSEVSAAARRLNTEGNETYQINCLEAGTTVLSSQISLTANETAVVGTVSDASIADNAKMTMVLTLGGSTPQLDDLMVLMTFKVAHTS